MAKKSDTKSSFKLQPAISYISPPCPNQCNSKKCKDYKKPTPLDLSRHVFIWLYGGPGSGKGTQCAKITEKYGFIRLHCGELLTQEVATGSVRAKMLQLIMERGELVPNDKVIELLKSAVEARMGETTGFIIDGYPRDERQGALFEKNLAPVDLILYLDVIKDSLTTRHLERAAAEGKRWDDDTGKDYCAAGKIQLKVFFENHKHILDKYLHKITRINAERTVDEIFAECEIAIDKAVHKHHVELREKLESKQRLKELSALRKERLHRY